MMYQKDAHHYRKMIRRKQRLQRVKSVALLTVSLAMMLYAIPCFATSIWDADGSSVNNSSIAFTSNIAERAYKATEEGTGEEDAVYDASGYLVGETTGPGLLEDEDAVKNAKLRAQAVSVATAEKNARMHAARSSVVEEHEPDLIFAFLALGISIVCLISGIRTLLLARKMRGQAVQAAYDSALRAL